MEGKEMKFAGFFPQGRFVQKLKTLAVYSDLLHLLTLEDLNRLSGNRVAFVMTFSPSSTVWTEINLVEKPTIISFSAEFLPKDNTKEFKCSQTSIDFDKVLNPKEILAILLHEIGHVFNPNVKGLEGEYAADQFANQKGQGRWIISSLRKGVKNNWLGFDQEECDLRIYKLQENLIEEEDEQQENDLDLDDHEKFDLDQD